jgi:hypothetical protein
MSMCQAVKIPSLLLIDAILLSTASPFEASSPVGQNAAVSRVQSPSLLEMAVPSEGEWRITPRNPPTSIQNHPAPWSHNFAVRRGGGTR